MNLQLLFGLLTAETATAAFTTLLAGDAKSSCEIITVESKSLLLVYDAYCPTMGL